MHFCTGPNLINLSHLLVEKLDLKFNLLEEPGSERSDNMKVSTFAHSTQSKSVGSQCYNKWTGDIIPHSILSCVWHQLNYFIRIVVWRLLRSELIIRILEMEIIHRPLNTSFWDIYQKLCCWKEMQPRRKIILHFDDALLCIFAQTNEYLYYWNV